MTARGMGFFGSSYRYYPCGARGVERAQQRGAAMAREATHVLRKGLFPC